jgi:sucrose-6-phosphate hydrolase SacC (GH32 family)
MVFTKPTVLVERGGVPSIVRDSGGKLIAAFQWFPMDDANIAHFDQVAVVTSSDNGKSWSKPSTVVVDGIGKDYIRPCDPALVVLDDGKVRMYFTSQEQGVKNAATYSAISSDGVHYTFEPGVRFQVDGRQVLDPTIVRLGNTWHYYAPQQRGPGKGYHATSDDGLTFKAAEDVTIPGEHRWLGGAVADGERIRFFGTASNGVWTATSTDGVNWTMDPAPAKQPKADKKPKEPKPDVAGADGEAKEEKKPKDKTNAAQIKIKGADPAAIKTADGRWLLIVTGPPREDAGQNAPPTDRPMTKPAPKPKATGDKKSDSGEKTGS